MARPRYITRAPALWSLADFTQVNQAELAAHYALQQPDITFEAWCEGEFELLLEFRQRMRDELQPYRNHCYRQ